MLSKIRPALALTLALSLFNGCWWDTNSNPDAPTISGLAVSPSQVAKTGEASKITGTIGINTDNATVSYKVTNASGDVTGKFTIGSIPGSISGSSTLAGTILATSADDGSYTFAITVSDADGQITSQTAGFTVGVAEIPSDLKDNNGSNTLTLGAQSASAGSFLNVDGFEVFKSDNDVNGYKTTAQKQSIDVVFFATDAGVPTFFAPTAAATAGLGGVASWGADAKSTIIVDAGVTPILTKAGVVSAIGSQTTTQATVQTGHYYALKLSNGKYAVLNAILSGAGKSASVTVDILSE